MNYERFVLGHDRQPLQPLAAKRTGNVVRVEVRLAAAPLLWDDELPASQQTVLTECARGHCFELRLGETSAPIRSVASADDNVEISAESNVSAGAPASLAATNHGIQLRRASRHGGQLHDSDSTVGALAGVAQPNHAVSFELPLP